MNVKHKATPLLLGLGLLAAFASAQADPFVGKSSNEAYVKVGKSTVNGGPHQAGNAGIAVNSTGLDKPVDFKGLASYGGSGTVKVLNFPYSGAPTSHDNLGVFAFVQAGTQDVWAGEWNSKKTDAAGLATHTVYFIGDNADTSVPASGSANYAVTGINNYNGSNALSGTFTANFGAHTLTGSIQNATGFAVNIGTATINSNASISGNGAVASISGTTLASNGAVSGQFFNSQASLAGIATFANNQYDTAFVGTK
ncbi:MAG TPA: hypothetical protein DDZ67_08260 [Xanthomonadaceae bacterium]|nr:hypothetical protein [Xanthomonadaceae bacterium]